MKRVYLSGAQKLNKKRKAEENIAKTPKITTWFDFLDPVLRAPATNHETSILFVIQPI